MRCPKCKDKVEEIEAGNNLKRDTRKQDWVLACVGCPWQVARRELKAWLDRWRD